MKIVFFRHSLLSRGGDRMIVAHASHLAADGHDVRIRTNVVRTVFAADPRVSIEPLKYPGKIGTLLSAAIEKHDADYIIADVIPLISLLFFRNRRNIVYFAQDFDESYFTSFFVRLCIRLLYVFTLTLCKIQTIAVSHHLADLLRRRFKARVVVVENGVDSSIFYPQPDPEMIAAKTGKYAILFLSRSDPRKGFDISMQVVARLALTDKPIEVWTVGDAFAWKFPGIKHRHFGYVDGDELRRIMSSADLFLYPTRHEGYGLMVVEAFACRCPVVTTEAVPFAINGVNALVSPRDNVEKLSCDVARLLSDDALAERLMQEGCRFARSNTLDTALRAFPKALDDLRHAA